MSGTASPPLGPLPTDAQAWAAPLTPEQRAAYEAIGACLAEGRSVSVFGHPHLPGRWTLHPPAPGDAAGTPSGMLRNGEFARWLG